MSRNFTSNILFFFCLFSLRKCCMWFQWRYCNDFLSNTFGCFYKNVWLRVYLNGLMCWQKIVRISWCICKQNALKSSHEFVCVVCLARIVVQCLAMSRSSSSTLFWRWFKHHCETMHFRQAYGQFWFRFVLVLFLFKCFHSLL